MTNTPQNCDGLTCLAQTLNESKTSVSKIRKIQDIIASLLGEKSINQNESEFLTALSGGGDAANDDVYEPPKPAAQTETKKAA